VPGDDRFGGSDVITFVATLAIKPEHEDEFVAAVEATVEMIVVNEPGTALHVMHQHPTRPHTYVVIERYRDAEALKAHAAAQYMIDATIKLQEWLAQPMDVLRLAQLVPR
jgi:quinol monooxygenase YgiN